MSTILERMGLRERKPLSLPIRPTMEDQSSVFLGEPWSLKELQVGGPHHRTPIRQHKEDTMDIRKPLEQSRTWEHDGQGEETAGSQRCAVNKIKTCFRCGGGGWPPRGSKRDQSRIISWSAPPPIHHHHQQPD